MSNEATVIDVSKHQQSPQSRWQAKKQQAGGCRMCGNDRRSPAEVEAGVEVGKGKLKQYCRSCQDKVNKYHNKYNQIKRAAKAAEKAVAAGETVAQALQEQVAEAVHEEITALNQEAENATTDHKSE